MITSIEAPAERPLAKQAPQGISDAQAWWDEALAKLQAPTPASEVKSRSQGGTTLSYVDARFCEDRLDESVGPGNWQVKCDWSPAIHVDAIFKRNGEVLTPESSNPYPVVSVGIWNPVLKTWVWKSDIGDYSDIASVKGGYSDSFKRACVQWGIARDLYDAKSAARKASASNVSAQARRSDASGVSDWKCPQHGKAVVIPAGTSKAGKPYAAFVACPERNCNNTAPKASTSRGKA